jgi:chromosome segregation protein
MQLKSIKVSGFKSFADPTVIPLQKNLLAIVGPNGCGKSNIVDAVRCVLSGAARQLRGGTMPDVIFNGSGSRKPVGQASVELNFDNSEGRVGGEYAQYAEISIRREINRDGTSNYYLNGTNCRRRDIVDVFLGTGLGPESYAIIEQGMISRMIEAKPEELRVYLEEAAGISKYKERRRETENRIQHTRENLDRLSDHRGEIDKQLAHLKRQANAAERYKELKQEERMVKANFQALHYRALAADIETQNQLIYNQQNQLEAKIAEQRHLDMAIEKLRQEKLTYTDNFSEIQNRFYILGTEIASLEQKVKNIRERRTQLETDITQLNLSRDELQQNFEQDRLQHDELQEDMLRLEPRLNDVKSQAADSDNKLLHAEQIMHDWQEQWNEFQQHAAQHSREMEVEQTKIQHLEQYMQDAQQRILKLQAEKAELINQTGDSEVSALAQQNTELKQKADVIQMRLQNLNEQIQQQRQQAEQVNSELDGARHQLQSQRGRHSSLEALQQAALGKNDNAVSQWLKQWQLEGKTRLAEHLEVEAGWEQAVEAVLGPYLESVCVSEWPDLLQAIPQLEQGYLSLITGGKITNQEHGQKTSLASKITSQWPVNDLLTHIFIVENLADALSARHTLAPHESLITRDGIWLGKSWLRVAKKIDPKFGVLQRERELHELVTTIAQQESVINLKEQELEKIKDNLSECENLREEVQQALQDSSAQLWEMQAKVNTKQAQLQQLQQREIIVSNELEELEQQLRATQQQLTQSRELWQVAKIAGDADVVQKTQLIEQRQQYQAKLEQARQQARSDKIALDESQVSLESTRNQLHYVTQAISRAEKQLKDLNERHALLIQELADIETPAQDLQQQLAETLTKRLSIEKELEAARQQVNQIEYQLREQEKNRDVIIDAIQKVRQELEQLRIKLQEFQIHQTTHHDKINELGFELATLLSALPLEFNRQEWEEKINQVENRINRLGAINLAAISEYEQLSERKTYLDAQNNDLIEALTTLENAIRKIDRETRARLQDTYDKVNLEFNHIFQRIFSGGHAALELTEQDLLNTGIIVKAQPPGKRNTTIHLLSGGEKALTAIALVFALFHLNPSPFCILDEVDAPLDDINVGRFSALVKEMSKKIQFIFISHNKLSIEIAEQLIGVTMNEPGVSRLVSVDIDQAIAMAG